MKLVSFSTQAGPSWGVTCDGGFADMGLRSAGAYPDLRSFLAAGAPADLLSGPLKADVSEADSRLLPVIPNPEKIVMAALNYHEPGGDPAKVPDYPVLFLRLPSSQIAHGDPLIKPRQSDRLDFEGELAVIIGKAGRHIPKDQAMAHVAGYSIYNDGSVRDWQKHSHQFTPGKNFTGTGAFGPWMVEAAALPVSERGFSLVTRVNGVEKQRTDTSKMIFDIPYLISYISTFAPLFPGDVIVTGTCTGFGTTRTPPEFLSPGDVVEVEIEGIGTLSNTVEAER
ncbi:fumarylacetoacetate hydrolase family protein [Flavimaricola marinus]|uniref:Ureidoglycolate lyase n=1 Tax=Flavimaricola marinus TaxID=1819565 RepID=A0A238LCX1_9RHOB|nr:fumarylacetoacetate hydrolase family protein [Flavimaricola marinus]SMY07432.1 Ureidoglycolate lyase [Flavimaricola marinus]